MMSREDIINSIIDDRMEDIDSVREAIEVDPVNYAIKIISCLKAINTGVQSEAFNDGARRYTFKSIEDSLRAYFGEGITDAEVDQVEQLTIKEKEWEERMERDMLARMEDK